MVRLCQTLFVWRIVDDDGGEGRVMAIFVVGCCVDVDLVDAESLSKCGFGIVWTVVAGDSFHPVQSFHKFLNMVEIPRCSKADNQMPQSISANVGVSAIQLFQTMKTHNLLKEKSEFHSQSFSSCTVPMLNVS
jgi:hypothetical protein